MQEYVKESEVFCTVKQIEDAGYIKREEIRPSVVIGNYTINKLQAGEEIHLSNAVLIPDSELMNKARQRR